jgi:hypothetical protein
MFHANGDMIQRIHALMGPGLLLKKEKRVDALIATRTLLPRLQRHGQRR